MIRDLNSILTGTPAAMAQGPITASAASTNYIDNKVASKGDAASLYLYVAITQDFDNLTSLDITLQQDDNSAFSSALTVESHNVLLANAVAGKIVEFELVPGDMERYIRLYFTVNGSAPSAGKVIAFMTPDKQTNFYAVTAWLDSL